MLAPRPPSASPPHRTDGEWSLAVRQQAAIARLGQLGLGGLPLEDLLEEAMREVAEVLAVEHVVLFEVRADEGAVVGRAGFHDHQALGPDAMSALRVPLGRGSMPGYAAERGEPVVAPDLLADERFRAQAPHLGVPARAGVGVPITMSGQAWGVLAAYADVVRSWTDDEVQFLVAVATTLGLAIERARIEQELRETAVWLDVSLEAGRLGAWSWDVERDVLQFSSTARAIYGLPDAAAVAGRDIFGRLLHPDDVPRLREAVTEAVSVRGEHTATFRIRRLDDGEWRWVTSWGRASEVSDGGARLVGVTADVTERRMLDELREALLAREQDARRQAELAHDRLALLAEAGMRFGATLDPGLVLNELATLCAGRLASVTLVSSIDEHGVAHDAAVATDPPELLARMFRLREARGTQPGFDALWNEGVAARSGRSATWVEVTDVHLRAWAASPEHLQALQDLGVCSAAVVPLSARDRVVGVLTVLSTDPALRYEGDTITLLEELAVRAALAVDNARLFESRNRVARSLQSALLPPALPEIAGLGLAARYRVAEADVEIGGDFYDVMEVADGVWGVVVGDVCGRGPDAAALTGLVRHSVRTAVVRERHPSRVLGQTNRAVLSQVDDSRFCTAAYLRVQLSDGLGPIRVTACSAGHPRPVLVRRGGGTEVLDCAGLLLGVEADARLRDVEVELHPGDALVLYTDGVTEARRGLDLFGEDRLLVTLDALAGRSAAEIAVGVDNAVRAFHDATTTDDVAIVVLANTGPEASEPVAPGGATARRAGPDRTGAGGGD